MCKMKNARNLFSRIPVEVQAILLLDFRDRCAQITTHAIGSTADHLNVTTALVRTLHERSYDSGHHGVMAAQKLNIEAVLVDGQKVLQCRAI